jgi:hypothetical protein
MSLWLARSADDRIKFRSTRFEGLDVRKSNLSRNRSEPGKRKTGGSEDMTGSEHNRAKLEQPSSPNIALTLKHFHRRIDKSTTSAESKRLFLRVGDEVNHLRYEEWGIGVVMEVMTSSIPGGTCLARVRFQDGQLRCFNNDLDNDACCYYFGLRRYWNPTHGIESFRCKFFMRG